MLETEIAEAKLSPNNVWGEELVSNEQLERMRAWMEQFPTQKVVPITVRVSYSFDTEDTVYVTPELYTKILDGDYEVQEQLMNWSRDEHESDSLEEYRHYSHNECELSVQSLSEQKDLALLNTDDTCLGEMTEEDYLDNGEMIIGARNYVFDERYLELQKEEQQQQQF